MKVLFLATNPASREASTRYRVVQYFDALRAAGHSVELATFFAEGAGGSWAARTAAGLVRRAADVARATSYDVVVVHRELLPLAWNQPAFALGRRVPMVFDFDDAIFLDSEHGWRGRLATPASTRSLVAQSTLVLAGNAYLADWARTVHSAVEVMPTVVDTSVYRPVAADSRDSQVPVVGWVGSPSTSKYLDPLLPILDDLARSFRFRVRIVGAGRRLRLSNVEVESPPWHADNEQSLFQALDIGLYPLADDRWAQGKCGFKAIQYAACGLPSVVSPVGVVRDIVRDGVDGLWATSPSEWRDALASLLGDGGAARRVALGASARDHAVARWSLASTAPRFVAALERAAAHQR